MPDDYTEALIRQRVAEMSAAEFDQLVQETRPPKVAHTGNDIAAAEAEGRWDDAMAMKSADLWRQIKDQNSQTGR